jgi:hypothetical protein
LTGEGGGEIDFVDEDVCFKFKGAAHWALVSFLFALLLVLECLLDLFLVFACFLIVFLSALV